MTNSFDESDMIAPLVGQASPSVPPPLHPPMQAATQTAPHVALSPEQVAQILEAQKSVTKVRRAANVATFDGWMTATFAALTIVTSLTSPSGLFLGTGMAVVAFVEFRGAGQLRRLAPRAARTLGMNQLALAGLLIVYACWQFYASGSSSSELSEALRADPQMAQALGGIEDMSRSISKLVYVLLIFIAIFVQGGTALYYFSRQRYLDAHLTRTPKWVADLQRAGVAV